MNSNSGVLAIVALAAALQVACGANRTTETFTGTVAPLSSTSHSVAVAGSGEVTATLSTISSGVTVGLAIGSESAGACTRTASNDAATAGTSLSTEVEAGSHCVVVYDAGTLAATASYTLSVAHP